jgi:hypothetical protein
MVEGMGEDGASTGVGRPWLSFICNEHAKMFLDSEETFNNPPFPNDTWEGRLN